MTMLARSAIAEAIETIGPQDPAALLTSMDGTLRQRLSAAQHSRGLAVTTDAGLVWVDRAEAEVRFAGARIDLVTADGETIVTHAGGRRSLAGRRAGDFVNLSVPIRPGRIFYLLTDGLLDQSGGENGFGFGTDRLQALLRNLAGSAMVAQRDGMLAALATHQGTRTQTDDITVVAFCMG
jgi:serine phosphatase RsbU (regulator of sigma subunit)